MLGLPYGRLTLTKAEPIAGFVLTLAVVTAWPESLEATADCGCDKCQSQSRG